MVSLVCPVLRYPHSQGAASLCEQEQHLFETDVPVLLEQVMPGSVFKLDHPTALELSSESKKTLKHLLWRCCGAQVWSVKKTHLGALRLFTFSPGTT